MAKGQKIQAVKGTRDLLPPATAVWAEVESVVRRVFGRYGYREIRTPILEETDLFVRTVGSTTDIVGKEMYSFNDRKGRSLSLRPENTASVARAFVQHGMHNESLPVKLFYIGPQFRYERPQKGRYRQFYQIGAELIGDPGPWSDVEVLLLLVRFLGELGFEDLEVQINTVGDDESRARYRAGLVDFLTPRRQQLSADSQRRLETNPLRILDSKISTDREILEEAPQLADFLTEASTEHFATVCSELARYAVAFSVQPRLVRGLDYYTKTVFEIVSAGLGAQDAIVGGGRYDGLVAELGGSPLPGIGFAIGQDRLIDVLPEGFAKGAVPTPPVLIVPIGTVSVAEAMELAEQLRGEGIAAVAEMGGRSLKAALKRAAKDGCRWVALVGEEELASRHVTLRDLESGEQVQVERESVCARLKEGR